MGQKIEPAIDLIVLRYGLEYLLRREGVLHHAAERGAAGLGNVQMNEQIGCGRADIETARSVRLDGILAFALQHCGCLEPVSASQNQSRLAPARAIDKKGA